MLTLDPTNPVVTAVGRGMRAEMAGDLSAARAAYAEAWDSATDDPVDKLRWSEDALRHATAVGARVESGTDR